MGDDRRWMYDGWNINQAHSDEWIAKSNDFINRAFSLSTIDKIRCPCKCKNAKLFDKFTVSIYAVRVQIFIKLGFPPPAHQVWVMITGGCMITGTSSMLRIIFGGYIAAES